MACRAEALTPPPPVATEAAAAVVCVPQGYVTEILAELRAGIQDLLPPPDGEEPKGPLGVVLRDSAQGPGMSLACRQWMLDALLKV